MPVQVSLLSLSILTAFTSYNSQDFFKIHFKIVDLSTNRMPMISLLSLSILLKYGTYLPTDIFLVVILHFNTL